MRRVRIGLAQWTVRKEVEVDFVGTLRAASTMGYEGMELGGFWGLSPAAMKRLLDDLGLELTGMHLSLDALEKSLEREVDLNLAAANRDLICASLPEALRGDEEHYRQGAAALNKVGRRCKELGVRLSYYNHAFELQRFGNRTGLEILLDDTDPDLVAWEADAGWLAYGQQDPVAWIRRYAGRCYLVHLRDMTAGPSPVDAEFGEGAMDFAAIFAAATSAEWCLR